MASHAGSHDKAPPTEDSDGVKSAITDNRVLLSKELDVDVFGHLIKSSIGNKMKEINNSSKSCLDKMTEVLSALSRHPEEQNQEFVLVIAGLYPDCFTKIKGRKPTKDEQAYCMSQVSDNLRKAIQDKGHTADGAAKGAKKNIQLNKQFVQLLLIKDDTQDTSREQREAVKQITAHDASPNLYHDALSKVQSNVSYTDILQQDTLLVLLIGNAGLGKTTLSQWLALKWAENDWAKEFTCAFMLNLRFLMKTTETMTLQELLLGQSLYSVEGGRREFSVWLKHWAKEIILFIDGVDEIPDLTVLMQTSKRIHTLHDKATPLEWCVGILRKDVLSESTRIVASRPFVGLTEALKPDSIIQLLGFTPEMVLKYIKVHVPEEKLSRVEHLFEKNPILKSVSAIPFYTFALCIALQQNHSLDKLHISTYTQLAVFLILSIGSWKLEHDTYPMGMALALSPILPALAKLARHGLKTAAGETSTLVFDDEDFIECGITISMRKEFERTGLYTSELSPSGERHGQFMHLSTQELLGTAELLKEGHLEAQVAETGRFNMSQLFIYGLAMDQNEWTKALRSTIKCKVPRTGVEEKLKQRIKRAESTTYSPLMQAAFEAQSEEMAKCFAEKLTSIGKLKVTSVPITAIDLNAILFVSKHANITDMILVSVNLDDYSTSILSEFLQTNESITTLKLSYNKVGAEGAGRLADALKCNTTLRVLELSDNKVGAEGAGRLADALKCNTTLRVLDLSDNKVGDEGAGRLGDALKCNTTLTYLGLSDTEVGAEGAGRLEKLLERNRTLRDIKQ